MTQEVPKFPPNSHDPRSFARDGRDFRGSLGVPVKTPRGEHVIVTQPDENGLRNYIPAVEFHSVLQAEKDVKLKLDIMREEVTDLGQSEELQSHP